MRFLSLLCFLFGAYSQFGKMLDKFKKTIMLPAPITSPSAEAPEIVFQAPLSSEQTAALVS